MSEQAEIEFENEEQEQQPKQEVNKNVVKSSEASRLTITRKKVKDLSDAERQQLIQDAQNGLENDFFNVKLCKNGSTRITLRKQSTAQKILAESAENQALPTTSKRYLTDNQLLLEHVINLETSFNALKSKHKKLKKRYNELEGYLYNDDEQPLKENVLKDVNEVEETVEQTEPEQQAPQQIPQPQVQRRYVRSWRQLGQHN